MKKIIIVLPCYNEEEALPYSVNALKKIQKFLKNNYQVDILYVDDGSTDGTSQYLKDLVTTENNIFYKQLSANAGHQSALRAGLDAAYGYDAAIMMDADLQHPAELIPAMIKKWEEGAAIVQMTRNDSAKEAGFLKFQTSKMYYGLINWLTDLNLEYGASDFRLIDSSVIKVLSESDEKNLFLRGYFSWLPVARKTIDYSPNKRVAGTSKYTLKKLLDLAYKSIIQFSEKPLRIAVSFGLIVAIASLIYGLTLALLHILGHHSVSGWTSLMVLMLFCFGVNFILFGILGSYLAHSINLQKKRPEYVIGSEKLPTTK